jgi:pimeloyl-ACP methyl ester carboxylesterase
VTAPTVSRVPSNGIELAYETFGDRTAVPVVLVMGLGTQMIAWPDRLCEQLATAGRYVVRFDNRDVGLSTHLDDLPAPALQDVLLRRRRPAYLLDDMSEDLLGLLDALDLDRVHLVGASMGGFISQTFALAHPGRVQSLTLMMTSTGSRRVGQAKVALAPKLLARRGRMTREQAIEAAVSTFRTIG